MRLLQQSPLFTILLLSLLGLVSACNSGGGEGSSVTTGEPGNVTVVTSATITANGPIQADGESPATVTIFLKNSKGQGVAGVTPSFTATGTGNSYGACTVTVTTGMSRCTMSSTVAQTKTLKVTSPIVVTGGTVIFHAGSVDAANSTITGTTPVVADGVATSTITITLRDANNNTAPGVTPTFSATNTGGTNDYGACSPTDASGVSTCTLSSQKAEVKALTITAPVNKAGDSVTFTAGDAVAANSTITGTSGVTANGVDTSTVTITLKDAFMNPVPAVVPTFLATDTGTTNSYAACPATDASGVTTCTFTSTKAENKVLSIATPVTKPDGSVTFVAGPVADTFANITGAGPTVANGVSTSAITVYLADAFNNPVAGLVPTFSVTGSNNNLGACSIGDASGNSTCTLASTKAETKDLAIVTPVIKTGGQVTFVAGPAVAANSFITGTSPVIADNVAASTVTITLADAFNNLVQGVTPTFSATDTGNTNVYTACSASDVSGVSTCTMRSLKAETKTLAITAPVNKADGSVVFEAGPPAATLSTIVASGPVVANGVATATVTITVKDAAGNGVPGEIPTFTATNTGSTNSYGACSTTNASGVSTCTFTSTKAESKTLSITAPVSKTDGSVSFIAGPVNVAYTTITGTTPVVADGVAASTVTITLKDAFNNPVESVDPLFLATDTDGTNIYGACSGSDSAGVSICSLSSFKAEVKTLTLTSPVNKSDGTVTFTPGGPIAANSSITGTSPVVANGVATSTVTITLRDANNNPVPGETPTFSATDSGTTNGYGVCSATDAAGVSTCTLTSTKAEAKTLSIVTPVSKTDGSVTFTAGAAVAANSTITGTTPVVADGSATSTITVTLRDAFNNEVPGVNPTFSATDTGTTNVYGACSATDSSGVSTCTLSSLTAEVKTLAIVTPVSKVDGTVSFTAGTPVAANSNITGTSNIVANGVATSTVTITLRDAFNNPVPGETPTFGATDTGSTNTYGACSATNASGVATCTLAATKAETKTLAIATPVTKADGTVTFIAGPAVAANSSITGTGPVVADGAATSSVTITLMDAFMNPVPSETPTFAATDTGATNSYAACSATSASGVSTCTMTSLRAESKTLSITAPVTKAGGSVVFTAGAPVAANSSITGTGPVVADSVATSTVSVTLRDAFNNPVAGITPTFSATDTGSSNIYGACSATSAAGIATCTLASGVSEVKTLSIVTPVSKADGTVTFTAGTPVAANSNITGTGPVVANGVATSTVTITLRDASNNPVPGRTPTFSATDTDATNSYTACSVTDTNGESICTLASTKAEVKTLAIATPVSKSDGTVTFTAGAPVAANSNITGTGPVMANGSSTSSVTVSLRDAFNNPVSGATPTFSATDTGTTNTYGACSATDVSGVSTCTLASTKAEVKTLAIVTPVSKTDGTVTFTAGAPVAATSNITGTSPVIADGAATSTVTITLRDAFNNPVSGSTPTFSATDTGSTNTYGGCSATDVSGVSTCTLASLVAEAKTLSIATPVVKADGVVVFEGGTPVAANSTITGSSTVVADGVATSTITITLKDANNNGVAGQTPSFSATDTGTTNTYGACSTSNTSGVSTCTLTSTKAEVKTLAITAPVSKTDGAVTFVAGAAVAANSTITGTGPVVANGSATSSVTITLKDAFNNEIAGTTPTFSATDTNTTNVYGACSASNTSGVSTCTLASSKAETKTLAIVTPVAKSDGTVVFTAGTPIAANSSITGTGPVVANGVATSTVTITLRDAGNNPVAGQTPTFAATDTSATNTYGSCSATNASGVSTCTLASTKAEVKTLAIATPVSKSDGTVTFTAGAALAANSAITGTTPVVADGAATSTVTITLKDAFNNEVSGSTPTFTATGTGNTLGSCSATNASGISTCTLASTVAESKTLAIATPVTKTGDSVTFTAGTPVAANSTITGTGPVTADGASTSTVTITLKDVNNNTVAGVTPTFSATNTSTGNTYGACSASDASGVSTCTLASTVAEVKTLSIATPVSKAGGTVTFTAGAAVAANSTITGTGPVVANDVATSTVTVTLRDASNNPVSGQTPTFSTSGTNNTQTACGTTNASGVATCTVKSTKAEVKTLAIVTPVSKTGGTVTFTAGAASSSTTTIAGTTPVQANGVATSFITITILDAYSNPISGTTPIFNATDTGTTNTYGACSASNASGVSNCTLASTKAETKTLQLTSPTAVTGGTVVFTAATPSATNSTIAGTGPVTADGVATSTVTITLKDAFNNPVPGQTPNFSATNTGSTNTYGSCTMGDTLGVSSCTLASTKAEVKTLSITAPVTKAGGTVTFTPGLPGSQSTITGTGPVLADGVADSTITITIKDDFGNVIAGVTPEFSASGAGNTYDDCSVGNASGVSTCTMQSTSAGTKTLSITNPVAIDGGTVDFTAGGAIAANSTITGTGPVVADNTATSTVTVTLRDAFNNPVAGQTPTFSTTGTGNTQTACGTTNASGQATCTVKSTKAEVKTLAIVTPVTKTGGTVTFTPGAADATNSTITGTGPIAADGTSTSTITITLKDAFSNNISGTVPTFSATGTGNTLGTCSSSNTSGVSTCTLASSVAETKTLAIVTPVAKTGGTVVFQAGGAVAANSTIAATGPVTANGVATSTVTITLKDNSNNPVAGVTPTYSATDTNSTNVYGACSATNASGISTCTFTSTKAEVKTVSIATPVVKAGNTTTFTAGPASAATSTIAGTSPTLANGTDAAGITITLLDAFNNPIAGTVPTFSSTGTSNTIGTCSSSDTTGVSTCTLRSTKAEGKTIALVTPVAVAGQTIDFNPNGINIQVPIEILGRGLLSLTTGGTRNIERSRTSLNTDDYVAESNTYYFEINAQNTNTTTAYPVSLVDNTGTELPDSLITVAANTTAGTRLRVQFTPNDGADVYRIRFPQTAVAGQLRINSARIIVEQVKATDTKIYIPLVNFDETSDNGTDAGANGQILSVASTTITTSAGYMTYWQRADAQYDAIPPGNSWTFEAVASTSTTASTGHVRLYNRNTTTQVAQVNVTGSTAIQLGGVSFASNATNFADGALYDVRYSNSTTATTRLYKAGLWIKLKYLKKTEIPWRLSMRRSTTTTATTVIPDGRVFYEAAAWSNPSAFFRSIGSGTGQTLRLVSTSNSDTATTGTSIGTSIVTPSTQGISTTTAVTLVDGDRHVMSQQRASGTALMVGTFLIIRATE